MLLILLYISTSEFKHVVDSKTKKKRVKGCIIWCQITVKFDYSWYTMGGGKDKV